jgi:hypothetical protein
MRIHNQNITVRSVLFSKPAGYIYLIIFCVFVYKSLMLLPIWLTTRQKADEARVDYENKLLQIEKSKMDAGYKETDLGKERYQKDFFNKLDEGEELIVLYGGEKKEMQNKDLEERKMFWWQEWKQDIIVWWKNLQILKK